MEGWRQLFTDRHNHIQTHVVMDRERRTDRHGHIQTHVVMNRERRTDRHGHIQTHVVMDRERLTTDRLTDGANRDSDVAFLSCQAFAEELHERVRKEFWAYDVDEKLDTKQLHQIRYNVGSLTVPRNFAVTSAAYFVTSICHMCVTNVTHCKSGM